MLGKHSAHIAVQTIERMISPLNALTFYLVPISILDLPAVRKILLFQFHVAVFLCPKKLGLTAYLTELNSKISIYFDEAVAFLFEADPHLQISQFTSR